MQVAPRLHLEKLQKLVKSPWELYSIGVRRDKWSVRQINLFGIFTENWRLEKRNEVLRWLPEIRQMKF